MPIYTKTGDRGETRLFDGTRVPKFHVRVEAYGNVDELHCSLGAAAAFVRDQDIGDLLIAIQKELLALGAELADPGYADKTQDKGLLSKAAVVALEVAIDGFEKELPPLRKFILSGGGAAGALLHLARTVCRRAERGVVRLTKEASVEPTAIEYLNRLSDLLFVLARVVNHREGIEEIQW